MITTTGLMPTWRDMTLGTSTWFSTCCCRKKKSATPSARAPGRRRTPTATAGIAASGGPTIGISSPIAAMRARRRVRHAHDPETDGRRRADDGTQEKLASQPRADFLAGPSKRVPDACALRSRKQPHHRSHDAVGVHEQIERDDQNRHHAEHAAHESPDGDEDVLDGVGGPRTRGLSHRFANRDFAAENALLDQPPLRAAQ